MCIKLICELAAVLQSLSAMNVPGASSSLPEHRLICLVCRKQFSQYTCPRCNLRYCSLPCYKSHSARCLESFNRDNVVAEMRDLSASPDSRKRMMETLKRFHQEGEADFEDGMDLGNDDNIDAGRSVLSETTVNKIASGEQIELTDLSLEEKKAFLQAVASGELSHMIRPWEPWWLNPFAKNISLNKQGNHLVQPVQRSNLCQSKEDSTQGFFDVPPPPESPLPLLKQLTPVEPSPLLTVHLAEVLYSYCFTLRFYNGDWLCDALDAALTNLSVSQVLGQGATPETITGALTSCVETICSPIYKPAGGYKFALLLLDDAAALLRLGRPGVICSLSDLHCLFDTAAKDLKQEGNHGATKKGMSETGNPPSSKELGFSGVNMCRLKASKGIKSGKVDLKKLVGACRKIFFLLCWANEQSDDTFSSLGLLVEAEKAQLVESPAQSSKELEKISERDFCSRKHFIEEIY